MVPQILVIVGPTSSGKTALSIMLAKKLNGEVISADSRQVYRGLDIGSGKVTKKEMVGVKHHLLDVASLKKVYTASDYVRDASKAIKDILSRGKLPIICGGTGFYVDALVGRMPLPNVPPNPKLRARLEKKSARELFALLQKTDPGRARTIDRHNPVRLVRALEIAAQQRDKKDQGDTFRGSCHLPGGCKITWTGIIPSREVLQRKIHDRLFARMKTGMLAEARRLHARGLSWKRMESLGLEYRYMARYLQGLISKKTMLAELELAINQYAKRQITYWKRNKDIRWFVSARNALDAIKRPQRIRRGPTVRPDGRFIKTERALPDAEQTSIFLVQVP